jgi:hypothetical protein
MERLAVRDAALRALARLDAGQGIPVWSRRWTMIAPAWPSTRCARPCWKCPPIARWLAPHRSNEKVTVAKEVVRLLGELEHADVYPLLLEMDGRQLHRMCVSLCCALCGITWSKTRPGPC